MKTRNSLLSLIVATAFVIPGAGSAQQQERQALYVSVDCMKSTAPEYSAVETEVWQPMHQELVNQGSRNSWSLYRVLYGDRSKCDYYTVTTYLDVEQLNNSPDMEKVFRKAHANKDFNAAMVTTWESRQHVATELWEMVDSTEIKEHRYIVVNTMQAHDSDAYERMESRVFKPGHQALVDGGHRAGWAMYALVSPIGTSIPYNYVTVDFSSHLSPVPMAEAMMSAHPDRDLDALQELLQLRDQVNSETWVLIATTEPSHDAE